MKPRNINNSLPLQPLVPDQENKNKKNEEKSINPVKITMGSGLNYIGYSGNPVVRTSRTPLNGK